ncbi:MAG TPA: MFS transporter [Aggregatilineales bacterium]|nr:MFS transporter [Aggregatilineales bacterium]
MSETAPAKTAPVSLWRHRDFMKLWTGETISLLGSQITLLALPLTAAVVLKASSDQMGLLQAAEFAPFLLIGLFAGVWVDRNRRKPILMLGDVGRALLLGTVPLAALANILHMEQLYVVGFLVGILTVFFDVSYQSYLPSLVGRLELVEGNSKLEISRAITQVAGPGFAGVMIQWFSAPLAITLDALSFIVSAVFLGWIRTPEPEPVKAERPHIIAEVREGLGVVLHNRTLRSIAFCTGWANLFGSLMQPVLILYMVNVLGLTPAWIGFTAMVASVGGLLGAMLANRAARRFGLGRTIVGSIALCTTALLLVPLAAGSLWIAVPLLIAAQFFSEIGSVIYNINQVSLRQTITPHRLLGRMNASMRFIVWGTMPIGALIGGGLGSVLGAALGTSTGLRATLAVGALGVLLAPLFVYFSPVRALREQPAPIEEATA